MTRNVSTFVLGASLATAGIAQTPEWRYYRPGNTGLPGDYCQTIHIDDQDRPYIGAYIPFWREGGFARFEGDHWTTFSNVDIAAIRSHVVNDIETGPDGILWIATDAGLIRFDPQVGASSMVRFDETNTPLQSAFIVDCAVDPSGDVWLALRPPTGPGSGLARLRTSSGEWDFWTTNNGLPWGAQWPGWNQMSRVAAVNDPGGGFTVFFAGGPGGIGTWRDGQFAWNDPPIAPPPAGVFLGAPPFQPVDAQGYIWFRCTYQDGPNLYSGFARRAPNGSWITIGVPPGEGAQGQGERALRDGRLILGTSRGTVHLWDSGWSPLGRWNDGSHTYAFGEESDGAIWVGGIGGAARWDGATWQRYRISNSSMMGYHIDTIDFAPDGRVFMNGNAAPNAGGFNVFDGVRWTCVNNLNYGIGPVWGMPTDEVKALTYRAGGVLALGPSGFGLFDWDGANYYAHPLEENDESLKLAEDGLGRLWSASYRLGLYRIADDGTTRYDFTNSPLANAWGGIFSITPDPTAPGFVWITQAHAAFHTNGDTWQTVSAESLGLPPDSLEGSILCATPANDGTVWIGSMSGLFHLDPATGQFEHFNKANSSLPSDEVRQAHFAPDGTLWLASWDSHAPLDGGGITHVDGDTWTTYSYGNSRMPHNQINVLNSRSVPGGYELWVGLASPGIVVLSMTNPSVPGDVDADGDVDLTDLATLLIAFGSCEGVLTYNADADFNGSGCVELADLAVLLANFGT